MESAVRAVNYEGAWCACPWPDASCASPPKAPSSTFGWRADDLPADKLGAPVLLAAMNQWLLAAVNATGDTSSSTVWAYLVEGWHPIATLPPGVLIKAMYYDRTLSRLWIGCDHGLVFWTYTPTTL